MAGLSLAVFVAAGTSSSPVQAQQGRPEPLLFVSDRGYPPLSAVERGTPVGLDVDLVQALSAAMGRPIHLELLDFSEAQRLVLSGRADAVTDLGISEERRALFDFSDATITHEFTFFVRRDDQSVRSLRDVSGKRVAVTSSPFAGDFLSRQVNVDLVHVADFEDGFRRLVAAQIDVGAFDSWVAAPIARRYSRQVRAVGTPFATSATAIAVRKGRADLLAEINLGLRRLKADGTIARIESAWRPREMLFLPETRVEQLIALGAGVGLLVLAAVMAFWVVSLKLRMRERRAIETALAASEAKFSTAFRAGPDGMAIVDLESRRLLDVNDRFLEVTGRARRDVVGYTAAESGLLVDMAPSDAAARKVRSGAVRDVEFRVRRGTGEVLTVLGSGHLIELDGRPAALWVYRDVTRARELEAQLLQAQKMDAVGRLAAGVAHDFNNLLTVILGNCEVGMPRLGPDDPLRQTLVEIRSAAERAASLTGQLLAFSRRQIVHPRQVALNRAVRELQPMMSRIIGEDIAITLALDPDAGCVEIDPAQLHQVLVNLAANARDAMPTGGRLTIATRRRQEAAVDEAVLDVGDSGVGMDEATRARVFEPFFTTKDVGHGTGLGLATVHGIVTTARGAIDVDSRPGAGTRFVIRWPRSGNESLADVRRADEPAPTAVAGHEHVVIVEDEADVRELLHDYFERLGYSVISARGGEDALAICARGSRQPDLLITDVIMDGMSGRELADRMSATYPSLRVIYLSGYTDDAILRHGVSSSAVHFLQKPFALAALAALSRGVLDGSPEAAA